MKPLFGLTLARREAANLPRLDFSVNMKKPEELLDGLQQAGVA
jgi:hypothetical protein